MFIYKYLDWCGKITDENYVSPIKIFFIGCIPGLQKRLDTKKAEKDRIYKENFRKVFDQPVLVLAEGNEGVHAG